MVTDDVNWLAAQIKPQIDRPLVLVGLSGAGKSKTGYHLAQALDLPFIDSDDEIIKAAGMEISDIFAKFGEAYFRAGERRVLARLLDGSPKVIATGGGAIMPPETAQRIAESAISIWVRADIDIIVARTQGRTDRPLLNNGNIRDILEDLARKRYPVYEKADIVVDSNDSSIRPVIADILKKLDDFL